MAYKYLISKENFIPCNTDPQLHTLRSLKRHTMTPEQLPMKAERPYRAGKTFSAPFSQARGATFWQAPQVHYSSL